MHYIRTGSGMYQLLVCSSLFLVVEHNNNGVVLDLLTIKCAIFLIVFNSDTTILEIIVSGIYVLHGFDSIRSNPEYH